MYTQEKELIVFDTLYEPEFTRTQVAKELNVSVKSIERYIIFGSIFIPELKKYVDDLGSLTGKRLLSSDLVYLEEIKDLKAKFSHQRVIDILTRKYSNIEN